MSDSPTIPIAVTISRKPSGAFFLKGVLDCAGFGTTAVVSDSDLDFTRVFEHTHPDLIVYDATDSPASVTALRRLRHRFARTNVPLVIVSTTSTGGPRRFGRGELIELNGGPDDVTRVREAARRVVEQH